MLAYFVLLTSFGSSTRSCRDHLFEDSAVLNVCIRRPKITCCWRLTNQPRERGLIIIKLCENHAKATVTRVSLTMSKKKKVIINVMQTCGTCPAHVNYSIILPVNWVKIRRRIPTGSRVPPPISPLCTGTFRRGRRAKVYGFLQYGDFSRVSSIQYILSRSSRRILYGIIK